MGPWLAVVFFFLLVPNGGAAQILAGAARSSITPEEALHLAGDTRQVRTAASGVHNISARALAIDDGSGGRIVLLSVELLAIPRMVSEQIAAALIKTQALERGQILISASGRHSTPLLRGLTPVQSPDAANDQRVIGEYTSRVVRALVDLAATALATMQPVTLSFSAGHAVLDRSVGPSAAGPTVPVLRVATRKGDTLAVVFGYAQENATGPADADIARGDYPGLASLRLEQEFPGSVALFLRLCDGDLTTPAKRRAEMTQQRGNALAMEVERVLRAPMRPVSGPIRATLMEIPLPFEQHTREQFEAELKSKNAALARRAKMILAAYDARREPRMLPYPIQVIRFAKGFDLIALAGDPVESYASKIRTMLSRGDIVVAVGANDGAYVVTDSDTKDSAYARIADSIVDSGFPSALSGETEERILSAVKRAWKRLGK